MIIIPSLDHSEAKKLVSAWLWMAISALAIAGIFALPPVILRGPFFADLLPVEYIFTTSLVIHVDLSVLVWMLSMTGMIWAYAATKSTYWLYRLLFYITLAGMIIMAISPFFGDAAPLKNNYVPMLQNLPFILGLSLFGCGIFLQALTTVFHWRQARLSVLHASGLCAALITIAAGIAFVYSAQLVPSFLELGPRDFYELLFWGGGHILQFTMTTMLLIAWMWLSKQCGYATDEMKKAWLAVFILNTVVVLPTPLIYTASDLIDDATAPFTDHMIQFGGLAPVFGGLVVILSAIAAKRKKAQTKTPTDVSAHYLWLSLLLFGYGGTLGHMISGVNASIPAHYHGSIVGITLALIGLAINQLPALGYHNIPKKLALVQAYVYGLGQMAHITGLAWMGGYGALRKAPSTSQSINTVGGKALFFAGGGLAILGGLLFIVIALYALRRRTHHKH